jgi:hypothetical protein
MRLKNFDEYENINENINEEINLNFLNPKNWKGEEPGHIDVMLKKLLNYMKNNFSYNFFKYDESHSGPRGTLHYYEYKADDIDIKISHDGIDLILDDEQIDVGLYGSKIYDEIVDFLREKGKNKGKISKEIDLNDKLNKFKTKYSNYFKEKI